MSGPCERLSWDSEHFGFEIARVMGSRLDPASAAEIDRWCLERGVRCLYLLADADDPETARIASRHGYDVVDVRLTVRHELGGLGDQPWDLAGSASFRVGVEDDLEQLGR